MPRLAGCATGKSPSTFDSPLWIEDLYATAIRIRHEKPAAIVDAKHKRPFPLALRSDMERANKIAFRKEYLHQAGRRICDVDSAAGINGDSSGVTRARIEK